MNRYTLKELCTKVDLPIRTVRYYVQIGLIDKPDGETRAARYGVTHLNQLDRIKKWTAAGLSLERVRELLQDAQEGGVPLRPPMPGSVEVKSHLYITEGVEVVLDPARAGLTSESLRRFARGIAQLYEDITAPDKNKR